MAGTAPFAAPAILLPGQGHFPEWHSFAQTPPVHVPGSCRTLLASQPMHSFAACATFPFPQSIQPWTFKAPSQRVLQVFLNTLVQKKVLQQFQHLCAHLRGLGRRRRVVLLTDFSCPWGGNLNKVHTCRWLLLVVVGCCWLLLVVVVLLLVVGCWLFVGCCGCCLFLTTIDSLCTITGAGTHTEKTDNGGGTHTHSSLATSCACKVDTVPGDVEVPYLPKLVHQPIPILSNLSPVLETL